MSFNHTREERGLRGKLSRIGVVKSLYVRLPGNGARVTCVKSRNERRGYENNVAGDSKNKNVKNVDKFLIRWYTIHWKDLLTKNLFLILGVSR